MAVVSVMLALALGTAGRAGRSKGVWQDKQTCTAQRSTAWHSQYVSPQPGMLMRVESNPTACPTMHSESEVDSQHPAHLTGLLHTCWPSWQSGDPGPKLHLSKL